MTSTISIPCLGTSQAYFRGDRLEKQSQAIDSTAETVSRVVIILFAVMGLAIAPFSPLAAIACLGVSLVGALGMSVFACIQLYKSKKAALEPNPVFKQLEQLDGSKQLAEGIEISQELRKELIQIIPQKDAEQGDTSNLKLTFTLQAYPTLQFTMSTLASTRGEQLLAKCYENRIYTHQICRAEKYTSLYVPAMKPIYLTVNGVPRSVLVEEFVKKDTSVKNEALGDAVRQIIQFFLKINIVIRDPILFVPVKVRKLALPNLDQLTNKPHLNLDTASQFRGIFLDQDTSLLASLDNEELINIACDEFDKLYKPTDGNRIQQQMILAKKARLEQIRNQKPG